MRQILEAFIIIVFIFIQATNDISVQNNDASSNTEIQTLATVTHIVDGDTFDIASGERIRMIGIDTPERGEYFYKEASVRLGELIEGREVILTKDVSETDRYGRLLRHVYYNNVRINKEMIEEGFARFVTFPPDVAHVEIFKQVQQKAMEAKVGMWTNK